MHESAIEPRVSCMLVRQVLWHSAAPQISLLNTGTTTGLSLDTQRDPELTFAMFPHQTCCFLKSDSYPWFTFSCVDQAYCSRKQLRVFRHPRQLQLKLSLFSPREGKVALLILWPFLPCLTCIQLSEGPSKAYVEPWTLLAQNSRVPSAKFQKPSRTTAF